MKHKIMAVMARREADTPLSGRVEMDDAYLGGARAGGKRGRGAPGKTPFAGGRLHQPRGPAAQGCPVEGLPQREALAGPRKRLTDGLCWNALDGVVGSRAIAPAPGGRPPAWRPSNGSTLGNRHRNLSAGGPDHAASFAWRYNRLPAGASAPHEPIPSHTKRTSQLSWISRKRIAPLAALSNRIDGSAGRLLGREKQSPGFYRSWSAEGFSGFDECPAISPAALAEAQEAFRCRESARYQRMAPIVTRLSEALARNGRFAAGDRILDIAMSLERMHVLDEGNIGRKLRNRTARFLGTDAASEKRFSENVRELYDVRSDIVHNRLHKLTPERVHSAFVQGFDIARQSLFKLLREGPPKNWAAATGNPSQRNGTNREEEERPGGSHGA